MVPLALGGSDMAQAEFQAEWARTYLNELSAALSQNPRIAKGILSQIIEGWREKSLNALQNWLNSGRQTDMDFMKFCDEIVLRLEELTT